MKRVTVIGGGTGSYVVLSGLKKFDLDLGAIVSMMDSGGSTGRLRDQLGVLPPGDLRQCLVALSEAPDLWRELFLYRFENGDLKGHNFGNIFLSALEKVSSSYDEVVSTANTLMNTKGKVMPVTFEKTHLCVEYTDGTIIQGEGEIDENNAKEERIEKAYLSPAVKPNPEALDRILSSDLIIIGPGDLYTSIIPVLLVDEIMDAINRSNAQIIYIMNLMTKIGQTTEYKASDFVQDITRYLGRSPDYVLFNSGEIPNDILEWYKTNREIPVENDLNSSIYMGKMIEGDIINRSYIKKKESDQLTRSILRHDSEKLSEVIQKII